MYKVLRESDPIHFAQTKEFIITRYDDVKAILKSPKFQAGNRLEWLKRGVQYLENKEHDFTAIYDAINSFVLMLNPPQHTRIRTFVTRAWDNRDVSEIIDRNLQRVMAKITRKNFDAVAQFSEPLSIYTICDILGTEAEDYRYLKDLGRAMSKAVDLYPSFRHLVQMNEAAQQFIAYFRKHIRLKSEKPDEGLLSKLIRRNKEEQIGLEESELISVAIFLFIAGQETTSGVISIGILTLLKHPDQLTKSMEHPVLFESAVEEILRYDPTVQLLGRIAKEDFVVNERVIPAGATVTLVIGSANRDDASFDFADQFIIDRKPNRHLSFGSGIHFCLGDWLGRSVAQRSLPAFFQHFPDIRLVDQETEWNNNLAVRTLKSLRLEV
jgi:pimeloyl-[acyl-carrier protein] synthase